MFQFTKATVTRTGLMTGVAIIASLAGCKDAATTRQPHDLEGAQEIDQLVRLPVVGHDSAGGAVSTGGRADLPPPASVADTTFLVFSLVRRDGVIMPALLRTANGWAGVVYFDNEPPIRDPGAWALATSYDVRDTVGVASTLRTGRHVRICCGGEGNYHWAHSTDRSGEDVEPFVFPIIGYGFSSAITHAAFVRTTWASPLLGGRPPVSANGTYDRSLPTARRPTLEHVRELLDSLAPIPDSPGGLSDTPEPLVAMDIWEAHLEGEVHEFIQITQLRPGEGCFMLAGWLTREDPPEVDVFTSGLDDCDGKGHGSRRPWTLFKQDGITHSIVGWSTYGDAGHQLWRHTSGSKWEAIALPSVSY